MYRQLSQTLSFRDPDSYRKAGLLRSENDFEEVEIFQMDSVLILFLAPSIRTIEGMELYVRFVIFCRNKQKAASDYIVWKAEIQVTNKLFQKREIELPDMLTGRMGLTTERM